MSTSSPSRLRRVAGRLWWFVDGTRRLLLNLLFLALVGLLLFALLRGGAPALSDKTALVLGWQGPLVEQRSGSARDSLLAQASGGGEGQQVLLRDVLAVLDAAAKDPKISHAVLLLDDFEGAGLATLREVAAALQRFKASGKAVVAWGSSYDQRQYYLASQAERGADAPDGLRSTSQGFGRYQQLLPRRARQGGRHRQSGEAWAATRTSGEPYTANGPSAGVDRGQRSFLVQRRFGATYTDGCREGAQAARPAA